jgi:hypothetical protein
MVQFLPAPEWGSYALHAWFPGVPYVDCPFCPPGESGIYSNVSICTNATCTSAELVGGSTGPNLFSPLTDATRFLINVSSVYQPLAMVVSADYFTAGDFPTGGLNIQLLSGLPAAGGLVGFLVAVMAWRHGTRPMG